MDMNLPPSWIRFLATNGIDAVHWSDVGAPDAQDSVVLEWVRGNGRVLLTGDMDFAALIALANERGPSVLQLRAQAVLPEDIGASVLAALRDHAEALDRGAIVTILGDSARVRVLPIAPR